jgi:hypothetical protein
MNTTSGKVCALTAAPRLGSEIEGVLVLDRRDNLAKVDRREIGYRRKRINIQSPDAVTSPEGLETYIYISTRDYEQWGNTEYPIWRSYLDCTLAGYIDVWGRDGAERFIASTEGWEAPMLDDRRAPKYPRAVVLNNTVQRMIDRLLEENGIVCIQR